MSSNVPKCTNILGKINILILRISRFLYAYFSNSHDPFLKNISDKIYEQF